MAAKKLFTQIFIYFSKPLRLLYSLIIYEIVNFSFFALYSATSFFLSISEKCSYIRDCSCIHVHACTVNTYTYTRVPYMHTRTRMYRTCIHVNACAVHVHAYAYTHVHIHIGIIYTRVHTHDTNHHVVPKSMQLYVPPHLHVNKQLEIQTAP